jgi:hypothetical protein
MNSEIERFKLTMENCAKQTFEMTGRVNSMVIFLKKMHNTITVKSIPDEIMSSIPAKNLLAELIREKCKDPLNLAVALITEVNIRDENDVKTGDGLMLIVSSRDGDDLTIYEVDCDNKKVLGVHYDEQFNEDRGRFSNFFESVKIEN